MKGKKRRFPVPDRTDHFAEANPLHETEWRNVFHRFAGHIWHIGENTDKASIFHNDMLAAFWEAFPRSQHFMTPP